MNRKCLHLNLICFVAVNVRACALFCFDSTSSLQWKFQTTKFTVQSISIAQCIDLCHFVTHLCMFFFFRVSECNFFVNVIIAHNSFLLIFFAIFLTSLSFAHVKFIHRLVVIVECTCFTVYVCLCLRFHLFFLAHIFPFLCVCVRYFK